MKIIVAERVNEEINSWCKEQLDDVHLITWTSDLNYSLSDKETNIYHFMRGDESTVCLSDLPWTENYILNYRSIPGDYDLEFKDFSNNIIATVILKNNYVSQINTQDEQQKLISISHYCGEKVAGLTTYNIDNVPIMHQFFGKDKCITTYWQQINNKLVNTGMSLIQDGNEKIYNNYWEWHFEMFKEIIFGFNDVDEIISYDSPTMQTQIKNRRVNKGHLLSENN